MANKNEGGRERRSVILLLKLFSEKLRISLPRRCLLSRKLNLNDVEYENVKEGHFVVFAVEGSGEAKRFVVELCYLSNPAFLSLLKLAEEEYGFQRKGALTVPCTPEELQKVLEDGGSWATCN